MGSQWNGAVFGMPIGFASLFGRVFLYSCFPGLFLMQLMDPMFDRELPLLVGRGYVLDQGARVEAQLLGHENIPPVEATASFDLRPQPILLRTCWV
jgi:hypothetical protein